MPIPDENSQHVTGAEVVNSVPATSETATESVTEPAKVMRIGSMVAQLLVELNQVLLTYL